MGRELTVQTIGDVDAFRKLAVEWDELVRAASGATIFQSWDWIAAWLEVVHPRARMMLLTVRDGSQLVAAAPLYRGRMRLMKLLGYDCLRVLGDQFSGAEYPDVLIRGGYERDAIARLVRALARRGAGWDCLWLPNIAGWTGAADRLRALALEGGCHLFERPRDFAVLPLPATHDAYFKALSGNARSTLRRQQKRLEEAGAVRFERCERVEQLGEHLGALFELHALRWNEEGQSGSFARKPLMRRFYERFAPRALERGWLRLFALRLDGQIQAVQYGYAFNGTYLQLQEGFNPAAEAGLGNVLRNRAIAACIEEGLHTYDFLGGFSEHKRRWGAERKTGVDLWIGRRSWKNALLFHRPVWPTGRYLSDTLRPEAGAPRPVGAG
ncbi:MAG: hypothetical protein CHACPFDD_03846 [Phycisphaerae bacterium]|nr:hypothetical protein [Phycisphaerae bacterium]